MKRTEATGSIDGLYIDRNTELGREGTLLTAEDRNAIQEELVGVIEASGQILNGGDLGQLLKAITLKLGNVAETITGVKTFSDIPVLPAVNPTTDNQATRRAFVTGLDAQNVKLSGAQTIADVKTFSSIPVGPSANPTSGDQLTRKAYVDGAVSSGVSAHSSLTNNPHGVTRAQLGLGAGDSVNFYNLNPPVDNNDSTMPTVGIGGFSYATASASTDGAYPSITIGSGGTWVYIACSTRSDSPVTAIVKVGRVSGGSSVQGSISAGSDFDIAMSVIAWRIA